MFNKIVKFKINVEFKKKVEKASNANTAVLCSSCRFFIKEKKL